MVGIIIALVVTWEAVLARRPLLRCPHRRRDHSWVVMVVDSRQVTILPGMIERATSLPTLDGAHTETAHSSTCAQIATKRGTMHQYVTPTLIPHSVLRGNPLPDRVESKFVNTSRFKNLLLGHDNPSKVSFVLHGLEHGFDLGFRGTLNDTFPPNNTSAMAHKSSYGGHREGARERPHCWPLSVPAIPD